MRISFLLISFFILSIDGIFIFFFPQLIWTIFLCLYIIIVGIWDMCQKKHSIRRNFPVIGNFRFIMEAIRPEINQYFVESNSSGMPFSRIERSVVYQRAKNIKDTVAFGTQNDVYEVGYEWVQHSIIPKKVDHQTMRTIIGGATCKQPYNASLLNIGAMSFGALSKNAIRALNEGAKIGGFAHNTGEGGISEYHLHGGDLIWQIGTGYFGCRTKEGCFDPKQFMDKAQHPSVKMIEVKLSQGAKPGRGGLVPAVKVSEEIAKVRNVDVGQDVISPMAHSTFDTPIGLCEFIGQLRKISNGKPIGIKLCLGKHREFVALCKAMNETRIYPDFITVDGAEGGTGAAPLEFANYVGNPLTESLVFVHNVLVGFALRKHISVIASGKITTGFGMIHRLATGADLVYSARGMMLALGCIQSLKCDSNTCPVGVATQDPRLIVGLVPEEKRKRVANYHKNTITSLSEMIGSIGIVHPRQLQPYHLTRRVSSTEVIHYGQIFNFLKEGDLLGKHYSDYYRVAMQASSAETFDNLLFPDRQ